MTLHTDIKVYLFDLLLTLFRPGFLHCLKVPGGGGGLLISATIKAIVSQPSKCLKFMTFREGCFVINVDNKYLTLFGLGVLPA